MSLIVPAGPRSTHYIGDTRYGGRIMVIKEDNLVTIKVHEVVLKSIELTHEQLLTIAGLIA